MGAAVCVRERDVAGAPYEAALRLAVATLPRGTRLLLASDFHDVAALSPFLRACANRFDCTALLLRDPWHAGLPLAGFVRLRDAETGASASAFVDRRARERFAAGVAAREHATQDALRRAGCRLGVLDELTSPEAVFARTFGFA
ncbi:MAG: hypothetical protein IAI48_07030 [Candidatus Eremiobacteraeota bacterium]|nr:hypothetical protein [Candidatus Eremiobacteraeota bacterium]